MKGLCDELKVDLAVNILSCFQNEIRGLRQKIHSYGSGDSGGECPPAGLCAVSDEWTLLTLWRSLWFPSQHHSCTLGLYRIHTMRYLNRRQSKSFVDALWPRTWVQPTGLQMCCGFHGMPKSLWWVAFNVGCRVWVRKLKVCSVWGFDNLSVSSLQVTCLRLWIHSIPWKL